MRFNDAAYLIAQDFEADAIGNQVPKETRRRVFVNPFGISLGTYSAAALAGLMPECDLQMRTGDYCGEQVLEFHGERMHVISANVKGDFTRITAGKEAGDVR